MGADMEKGTRVERQKSSLAGARILAVLIFIGAAAASLGGLFLKAPGGLVFAMPSTSALSVLGEEVSLDGQGLYARDSASGAAQERAQDLVTLVLGLPLLAAGFLLSRNRSFGGSLLLGGGLGYFLYCYGMMAVGTAYNEFFLLYVAIFAASLWAFALCLASIDADGLAAACARSYPRRWVASLSLTIGLFLALNWLGSIVLPSLTSGRPPKGLEAYSTLFVQALDLGVLVPAAFVTAFWLFRCDHRGFLLGTVLMVKGTAEGLAVATMGFNMLRLGISESLPMVLGFLALSLLCLGLAVKAVASAGFGGQTPA